MTHEELVQATDVLVGRLQGWEQSTLETIGERIKKAGRLSQGDALTLRNIANITGDMQQITKDLADITNKNIVEMNSIYNQLLSDIHADNKYLYDFRNYKYVPYNQNKALAMIAKEFARVTANTMINLSNTKAIGFTSIHGRRFIPLAGAYQDAVDKAVFQLSSGAVDFNTAMRQTIKALGGSGVRTNYDSGVSRRLDTVIRQNLLYGAKQVNQGYQRQLGQEIGADSFFVDYHPHPRPSHAFMGGQEYIIGEGDADLALERLDDHGCLHFATYGIYGISQNPYDESWLDEQYDKDTQLIEYNGEEKTAYEWTQEQRKLETAIRSQKDITNIARASGDTVLLKQSQENIKGLQKRYNSLSDATDLQKKAERMGVSGYTTKGRTRT